MRLFGKLTREALRERLLAAGASVEVAEAIADTLVGCGLSGADAWEWLAHQDRAYPIRLPHQVGELPPMMLANTPLVLVEKGNSEAVLAAALEYAEATDSERVISRLLGGDIDAVRRLTRSDPERAEVIAGIATTLLKRVGTPERVCAVGQTRLPGHGDRRMVDRLLAGEHDAVAAELADGTIDPRALERTGELVFIGW